jgi:hypothetical protein
MKTVSYISSIKAGKRYDYNNPITQALNAWPNNKITESITPVEADAGFCFGSWTPRKKETERARLMQNLEASDQPIFYLDSAAYSTYIRNHLQSSETYMFRIGLNSCTGTGTFWKNDMPSERYEAFKNTFNFEEKKPQNNKDGHIVFLMQSEKGFMYDREEPFAQYCRRIVDEIREKTNRKIIFRVHPNPDSSWRSAINGVNNYGVDVADSSRMSLFESLHGAFCCVTHSSSAAVESVVEGIPTFALDDRCFGSGIYLKDISRIENAYEDFNWEKREQWLYNLSYTSWTVDEMAQPELMEYYLSWLK